MNKSIHIRHIHCHPLVGTGLNQPAFIYCIPNHTESPSFFNAGTFPLSLLDLSVAHVVTHRKVKLKVHGSHVLWPRVRHQREMLVYLPIYLSIHPYIHTYIHTCIHAYMHTCIHAYMHTCIHAYMHTCIHAYMHTCIHAYMHTCIHAYILTYLHTYILTHLHTYLYMYTDRGSEVDIDVDVSIGR